MKTPSGSRVKLAGPASDLDKILYKSLKDKGLSEEEIPKELQDIPVARSRKGPLGALVIRRMSGMAPSPAKKTVEQFEENIGGNDQLAEGLEAIKDTLNKEQMVLLSLLNQGTKKRLTTLIAESGAEITGVMSKYAKGAIELGKVKAAIEAHRNLPLIVKELSEAALSKIGICGACHGLGSFPSQNNYNKENKSCYFCSGTGVKNESDLKKFAIEKMLDITKLTGDKGPMVAIQNNVVAGSGRGSVLEKMMLTTDEVLYKRGDHAPKKEDVVDAEVVPVQS